MQLHQWMGSAVLVSALLVTGCAGTRKQGATASAGQGDKKTTVADNATPAASDPDTTYICSYERPTGSNIPVRICRSLRQIQSARDAAQQEMDGVKASRIAPQGTP